VEEIAAENVPPPRSTADASEGQNQVTADVSAPAASSPSIAPGRRRLVLWAVAGGAALLAVLAIVFNLNLTAVERADSYSQIQITRLTESGEAQVTAISPDGRFVAYALCQSGLCSIWLKQVGTNGQVQIVTPTRAVYEDLTFSRDGASVYFLKKDPARAANAIYQMPVLGGPAKELISGLNSTISLSPDGRQLAFVRDYPNQGEDALIVAWIDGTGERELARRKHPNSFLTFRGGPSWSPDGRIIACPTVVSESGISCRLIGIRVSDGAEEPISAQRWLFISKVAWLPDGSGLLINGADRQPITQTQIWHLTYPGGMAERVTNDSSNYFSLSSANTGMVAIQKMDLTSIWVATDLRTGQGKQLITSKDDLYGGLTWTPDGRIIYGSRAGANIALWIMKSDGSDRQLLVDEGSNGFPFVSRDGHNLIFTSIRAEKRNVWRQDLATRSLKRITDGNFDVRAQSSPDGHWIVYDSFGSSTPSLWKVPFDGGPAVRLTEKPASSPDISPDGQTIACNYLDEAASRWRIAILPFTGGQPIKVFDIPTVNGRILRWSPDGRAITYIETRGGISNIWSQPIEGGEPRQMTSFTADTMVSFSWSHDGRQLAFQRGREYSDVVFIRNFLSRPAHAANNLR
jgi:Tol biopolymer transport system component